MGSKLGYVTIHRSSEQ